MGSTLIDAAALLKLNTLGLTAEQYAGVLDVIASATQGVTVTPEVTAPSSNALRQRRFREKQRALRVTDNNVSAPSPSPAPSPEKEKSPPAPPLKKNKPQPQTPSLFEGENREASPRHVLESVLDVKHAAAVIDHRQRLRKPLTAHAADLLARKLALCRDPNAAADLMIEKGWQSIEPEWMENRNGNGSRNAPRGAHNGGDSRGSRLMRAFGLDAEVERGRGDGPTIDGHAAERSGD